MENYKITSSMTVAGCSKAIGDHELLLLCDVAATGMRFRSWRGKPGAAQL